MMTKKLVLFQALVYCVIAFIISDAGVQAATTVAPFGTKSSKAPKSSKADTAYATKPSKKSSGSQKKTKAANPTDRTVGGDDRGSPASVSPSNEISNVDETTPETDSITLGKFLHFQSHHTLRDVAYESLTLILIQSRTDIDEQGRTLPLVAFHYKTTSLQEEEKRDWIELTRVTAEVLDEMFEMHFRNIEHVDYVWTEVGKYSALAPRILKFGVDVHFHLPQRIPSTSEIENILKKEITKGSDFHLLYLDRMKSMKSPVYSTTKDFEFIHDPDELESLLQEEEQKKLWEEKIVYIPFFIAACCLALVCCYVGCSGRREEQTAPRDISSTKDKDVENQSHGDSETMVSDFRTCVFSDDGASQVDKSTPKAENKKISGENNLETVSLEDQPPTTEKTSTFDSIKSKVSPFFPSLSFSSQDKDTVAVKLDPPEDAGDSPTLFTSVRDIVAKKNSEGSSKVSILASAFSSSKKPSFSKIQLKPVESQKNVPASLKNNEQRSTAGSSRSASPFAHVELKPTTAGSRSASPFVESKKPIITPALLGNIELKKVAVQEKLDEPSMPIATMTPPPVEVSPAKRQKMELTTKKTNSTPEFKQKYQKMLASKEPKPKNLVEELKLKLKDRDEVGGAWKGIPSAASKEQKKEPTPEWKKKFKEMGLKKDDASL